MASGDNAAILDLTIRPDAADVRRASEWLGRVGRERGIPQRQIGRLDICLNEALANVIGHGELPAQSPLIGVQLEVTGTPEVRMARVTISDHGTAFDPLAVQPQARPATLSEAEPGGLGLLMIREFSDSQRYVYADGQNRLSFCVRWNEAEHVGSD